MKCVSIVYKRPTNESIAPEFIPVRSLKRSVDEYVQKLMEKQQLQKNSFKSDVKMYGSRLNSVQTLRPNRIVKHPEMPDSINVYKMKYSCDNIFKHQGNPQFIHQKKQKKFRSTFVKRNPQSGFYSLKGIKTVNQSLFDQNNMLLSSKRNLETNKFTSKLMNLKRLKLTKPNTVVISVDFILNENNFWQEQKIDEAVHKNWKQLQQHSNVVWLTKRQNSSKKLQKYASEYGLRLDGVYKIVSSKKGQTLVVSLSSFQKDFRMQAQAQKIKQLKRQVIVINSLKVDQIKDIGYQEFYNSFPVLKSMRSIVHFIQIDMNDKNRFNSPLKILSKDNLPAPNSVIHLFKQFHKENQHNPEETMQSYIDDINNIEVENQDLITKQQMMAKYETLKEQFVNYFGNHLKINLNRKIKIDQSECSVQFVIGDMLKRNFNIMYRYNNSCIRIKNELNKVKEKTRQKAIIKTQTVQTKKLDGFFNKNQSIRIPTRIDYEQLIKSKLNVGDREPSESLIVKRKDHIESNQYYKEPVFLWKK